MQPVYVQCDHDHDYDPALTTRATMKGSPLMTATSDRSARLNMRIAPSALETIREAATAQQQDVTSFVLGAALDRARTVLAEERVLALTARETQQVRADLEREPSVIPELLRLISTVKGDEIVARAGVVATR